MGYIAHHTIVITSWSGIYIKQAHAKAVELFGSQVSELVESETNGYTSFFVAPDGSKEGWAASDRADCLREDFIKWMQTAKQQSIWLDWVEIRYGGDEPEHAIVKGHNT